MITENSSNKQLTIGRILQNIANDLADIGFAKQGKEVVYEGEETRITIGAN